jgi:hypothetical protein
MKRIPMILLLLAPGATLAICYLADLDLTPGLFVCGAILILNMVYAFLLPRLGFSGKQILFWNLLLKLSQVPLISLILLLTLVMAMVGGEGIGAVVIAALLACWLLMLSSSAFGISGFLWCHKYGTLSKVGMIDSMIAQLIPCVDVIGSILCYIMFRKEGHPNTLKRQQV